MFLVDLFFGGVIHTILKALKHSFNRTMLQDVHPRVSGELFKHGFVARQIQYFFL